MAAGEARHHDCAGRFAIGLVVVVRDRLADHCSAASRPSSPEVKSQPLIGKSASFENASRILSSRTRCSFRIETALTSVPPGKSRPSLPCVRRCITSSPRSAPESARDLCDPIAIRGDEEDFVGRIERWDDVIVIGNIGRDEDDLTATL